MVAGGPVPEPEHPGPLPAVPAGCPRIRSDRPVPLGCLAQTLPHRASTDVTLRQRSGISQSILVLSEGGHIQIRPRLGGDHAVTSAALCGVQCDVGSVDERVGGFVAVPGGDSA